MQVKFIYSHMYLILSGGFKARRICILSSRLLPCLKLNALGYICGGEGRKRTKKSAHFEDVQNALHDLGQKDGFPCVAKGKDRKNRILRGNRSTARSIFRAKLSAPSKSH